MNPHPDPESLSAFARTHRVTAEVFPHYEIHDHQRIQTGFELTLLARPSARCPGDPGCPECERVHGLLRDMALTVVPDAWHHAEEPFDAAFHYRRDTGWRPEIEVVVQLVPYGETWRVVDAAALRETRGIRERLQEIGVGEEIQPSPATRGAPS